MLVRHRANKNTPSKFSSMVGTAGSMSAKWSDKIKQGLLVKVCPTFSHAIFNDIDSVKAPGARTKQRAIMLSWFINQVFNLLIRTC